MSNTFATHVLSQAAAGLAKRKQVSPGNKTPARPAGGSRAKPPKTYASVVLMMAMGACTGQAQAASDGALARSGASSTAKLNISLTVPERLEASGLGKLVGGETKGCVLGHGSGRYGVAVTSAHLDSLALSYSANGGESQLLTSNVRDNQFEGAGATGCAKGQSNARLKLVQTPSSQSQTLTHSTPKAIALTLVISPE